MGSKNSEFMSPRQVVEEFGITMRMLRHMRQHGGGPPYYCPTSRLRLYKRSEVRAWIEAGRMEV